MKAATHEERFVSTSGVNDWLEVWRPVTVTKSAGGQTYYTDEHGNECHMSDEEAKSELRVAHPTDGAGQ